MKYVSLSFAFLITLAIVSSGFIAIVYAGPGFIPPRPPSNGGGTSVPPSGGGTSVPPNGGGFQKLQNPLKGSDTLQAFIKNVLEGVVIPIGSILAVLAIIYSGFLLVMAQGNDAKLKTAKAAFFMSVVGTAIILGSWVIAQAIEATVNQVVK